LIAQYGWAKVVTCADGVPCATYGFFLLEPSEQSAITVVGHFARADPQAADIQNGLPALLIFDGPHGYISASWYRPETTRIPSTWNHMSVHLHGVPEPLAEQEAFDVLARTLAHHEAAEEEPWRLQGPSLDFAHTLAPATIVFRLTATRVEAKAKLSQGKPLQMRRRIVERLDRPGPHMNMPLASEMRRLVLGSDLDGERTDSEL
ncbi:MAG TPA: FMN-binding negative transcriptional regulator, partial [Solirubrobacteraceae bacterium]